MRWSWRLALGRRALHWIVGSGLLVVGVAAWFFWRPAPPRHHLKGNAPAWTGEIDPVLRKTRPSLLLVVYDARRRDDFSFGPFGNARGDTPFLAQFKDEAVYFEDAVSPGCWTVPVHASMFSGRSVCDLGTDHYNPGYASFDDSFLSLAEILSWAGYKTVAYADHPYFYNRNLKVSLVRGFELFNVIGDFERYASHANVRTRGREIEHRHYLEGIPQADREEVVRTLEAFRSGALRFDLAREADYDPVRKVYLAKLWDLFRQSPYFQRRYGAEFDAQVFPRDDDRPFFLFLNLHMCTRAIPDPGLYSRWLLRTLLMNFQARGASLAPDLQNLWSLIPELTVDFRKQSFDNRFYDATFRAVWEYLEARGLTRNLVTVVTSDHGMSFGEKGETQYLHAGARPDEYINRVPLVVRFPVGSREARHHGVEKRKVGLTDIFQTLVDIGLGPGVFRRSLPIRGRSLVERLDRGSFEEVLVSESALVPDSYADLPRVAGYSTAVYSGAAKLVHAPELYSLDRRQFQVTVRLGPGYGASPAGSLLLLHDLSSDPHERVNLAPARPDEVARLKSRWPDWSCPSDARPSGRPEWDDAALRTFQGLGYIH
jgi:arylsulfatase A-like enzyme